MVSPELVIHAHFYQPPRENPWTEEVGRERSAFPAHDWNERIAAECYRPNGVARIVDDQNRVISIVDNYENISYNAGPTLLSWLEVAAPGTYRLMIEADKVGGGAIAQAFSHLIMPLATEADMRTQIRWGLADFLHRFGRIATGMWLPECAVNDRVLSVLIEEGVGFTVLAPGQAAQIRSLEGTHDWVDVDPSWLDTSRSYRWLHPDGSGRSVDIVFYNGSLSHALAFEMSSLSSQALVDRMLAAASGRPGMVALATDGETFGHHHRYGDRLLAYALAVEAPNRGLKPTNLNSAVKKFLPTHEVRVHESAWSCAHGVGRWKQDCSCSTGSQAGWNQRWRAPLRAALDQLRAVTAEVYERRAPSVLLDPQAALDGYVNVLIGDQPKAAFTADHVSGSDVEAFSLLEMHRHAMAMFTSCGWFFNDLAGLETVQVLRYAARVIDLLDELGEPSSAEVAFLAILEQAVSNEPDIGTGLDVWHNQVLTARVDAARATEHIALSEVVENRLRGWLGPYEIAVRDRQREQRGAHVLATGVAHLTHRRTGRASSFAYAALGLGGLEVSGVVQPLCAFDSFTKLRTSFRDNAPVSELLTQMADMGEQSFDLHAALPDELERMLEDRANELGDRYLATYAQLYDDHRAAIEDLARFGYELPPMLRAPAELALARRFRNEVVGAGASMDPAAYEGAVATARQADAAGFSVDSPATNEVMWRLLIETVRRAVEKPTTKSVAVVLDVLALVRDLHSSVNVEPAQEAVYFAMVDSTLSEEKKRLLAPLAKSLAVAPALS